MESSEHDIIKVFQDVCTWDKVRRRNWINVASRWLDIYGNKIFERHWTPEDIIKEVITRVLEGKRKYNPQNYKNIDHFIYWTIRSIIDDELGTRRSVIPMEKFIDSEEGGDFKNLYEQKYKTENDFIQKEFEIRQKLEKCYQIILEKDEDAALVLLCWKEGMTTQDIAEYLGIKKSEVEAAKKKIRYTITGKK